jgi:hypothetical protein
MHSKIGHQPGILNPETATHKFQLSRYQPAPDLIFFIERYWLIRWDLSAPHEQETLPYPCVNLVIEPNKSGVFGVVTGRFTRLLEDCGQVFGVKFRPGAFYPFIKTPISHLTNTSLPLHEVFGDNKLEQSILALENDEARINHMEAFIRQRLPEHDENVALINRIVDCIISDREIRKVDDITAYLDLNKRRVQRIFSQYVGVSPKWVTLPVTRSRRTVS